MSVRAAIAKRELFGHLSAAQVAFTKKVYMLLSMAICVFTGAAWYASVNMDFFLPISQGLMFATIGVMFVSMFVRGFRPISGFFLFTIVTMLGLALGPILYLIAQAEPSVIIGAGGTTIAIFLALTAYVHISGQDFSYLYGFLFVGLVGLIVVGLLGYFLEMGPMINSLYSYAGAMIFTLFILADTSAVTRRFYDSNDAAGAALNLFLDILNLFLFLIRIMGNRR